MYRSIAIRGFRGFEQFRLDKLARINLLVGANNSGKTSILEAVGFLGSGGDFRQLFGAMNRRGEYAWQENRAGRAVRTPRIRHMFRGHQVAPGITAAFMGEHQQGPPDEFQLSVQSASESDSQLPLEGFAETPLALTIAGQGRKGRAEARIPLTENGELDPEWSRRRPVEQPEAGAFITTAALTGGEVLQLASALQLTDEEGRVLDALRVIEPTIEAFRPVAPRLPYYSDNERDSIIVKLRGIKDPVPIGSLGDGTWRMLGIALSIASSADRVLLVDEIDTGLHYSVMVDMWKMVRATAERLGVQVFATTHSRDCVDALAALADTDSGAEQITIQRIERQLETATVFEQQEIVAAAQRGIEIR